MGRVGLSAVFFHKGRQLFSLIGVKLHYQKKEKQTKNKKKLGGVKVWGLVMQYFRQVSYSKVFFFLMVDCIAFTCKLTFFSVDGGEHKENNS